MKDDPFMDILMSKTESQEALSFLNRMSMRELNGRYKNLEMKPKMLGTETFAKLVKFVRMAFKEYGRDKPGWYNPFNGIDPPSEIINPERDWLPEEEVLKLFNPGVLIEPMELAVCAAMFLAGLRRSEVFALRPEDLDWNTPKITVRRAWQNFSCKRRVLGPNKSKRIRNAPFDKVLQEAIRNLWKANGEQEFVFAYKDGTTPGPSWIKGRLKKWLARAGIELNGRNITPHSSRHSLASMLEDHGEPLRHIQELLDHRSLKTTKKYLHSTVKTIRDVAAKIDTAIEAAQEQPMNTQSVKIIKIG